MLFVVLVAAWMVWVVDGKGTTNSSLQFLFGAVGRKCVLSFLGLRLVNLANKVKGGSIQ